MNIICYLLNFNINFLFKWLKLFLLVGLFSFFILSIREPADKLTVLVNAASEILIRRSLAHHVVAFEFVKKQQRFVSAGENGEHHPKGKDRAYGRS